MRGQRSGIRCGLKTNTKRILIFNLCKEHCCQWWGECNSELGNPIGEGWKETDPTEEELKIGLGHESNGEIKIWKRLKV